MSEPWIVLVGVDFSPMSRRALDLALAAAVRAGGEIELVHCWNPNAIGGPDLPLPPPHSWASARKDLLKARLEAWARPARDQGVVVRCRIAEGAPSRTLSELAGSLDAGLLVVGRRGSANLAHVLLGSVSERLIHLAPCPVLVVPFDLEHMEAPQRLLVGVDFSHTAKDAYRAARELMARLRPHHGLVLIHVQPPPHESWLESWSELAKKDKYPYDREALEHWAELSEETPGRIKSRVLQGHPDRVLLETARSEACDWIVVGARGRTALAAMLTGNTTNCILKLTDRPVVVVPSPPEPPAARHDGRKSQRSP